MKTIRLVIVGIALFFWNTPMKSNPYLVGYFNELQFTSSGWVLEMHAPGTNLDGWSLRSRSGTAFFKNGIQLGTSYLVLTQDSLLSPLNIDPLGDSLGLYSPQGWRSGLEFGNNPLGIPCPRTGQSICFKETSPQFYYLDNSPTPGLPNDGLNAIGVVHGLVTDSLGAPINGASIWWINAPLGYPAHSDTSGQFGFSDYSARFTLRVQHPDFEDRLTSVQVWPESTVSITIVMSRLVSVQGRSPSPSSYSLDQNHPNPFNPTTTFSFSIPRVTFVTLKVYDIRGKEVATVVNEARSAGVNEAVWDASGMATGVYFYRLFADGVIRTRKMLLIR